MRTIIFDVIHKIGIDKSIAYSSGARIIQAVASLVSLFFIVRYLTGDEQGYYYTFNSIIAIQVFFELGLTGIITQFVAHEAVHINESDIVSDNDAYYKSRLSSLLHFCLKWYTVIAVLMFIILSTVGFAFFNKFQQGNEIDWKIPWIILVFSTAIKLFESPFTSFIKGLGMVKEMNKVSFYQQLILPTTMWIGLILGFQLYIVGISSFIAAFIWIIYVYKAGLYKILKTIWLYKIDQKIGYMKEIFPMQWRIGVSWISGYFIFQLFNPVLFATEGAIVAGQMGMTLSVLNGIQSLSMNWIDTKIPLFSGLIALKEYHKLDQKFATTLKQLVIVCFSLLCILIFLIWGIQYYDINLFSINIGKRFLPVLYLILLASTIVANMFIFSWAAYLRCHKKEPFMYESIGMGVLSALSTLILGGHYGLNGMVFGYVSLVWTISISWSYWIFKTYKYKWHGAN